MNRALLPLLLVAAFIAGAWFGEDLSVFAISPFGFAVCLSLAALCLIRFRPASLLLRLFVCAFSVVLFLGGAFLGRREAQRAYNQCILGGEPLRLALHDFRQQYGTYPKALSELRVPLPGRRLLRGTLLRYTRTADGYLLAFSDHYVTHEASESERFLAHK